MMNDKLKKTLASVGMLGAFGLGGAALAGAQGNPPAAKSALSQPASAQSDERGEGNERGDRGDRGETDQTVSGPSADRAGQAALKAAGGGKVVSVERETPDTGADQAEPGDKPDSAAEQARDQAVAYDVEVQNTDGTTVEVEVDDTFKVLSTVQDEPEGTESGSEADEAPAQR